MNDMARRIMRDRLMRGRDGENDRRGDGHHSAGYGEYEGTYRGTYERDGEMEDNRRGRDYGEDYRRDRGDMRRGDRGEDYRQDRGDMRRGDRGEDYRRDRGDMRRGDRGEDYRRDREDERRDREGSDRGGYSRNRYGEFKRRDRNRGEDYASEGKEKMSMKRSDLEEWSENLENADGTQGPHFKKKQIMDVAKTIGVEFEEYEPEELVMVANMLYSDYCEALRHYIPKDIEKESMAYAKLAHAWLSDEDGPKGSEKLALYYYCIIEQDDE